MFNFNSLNRIEPSLKKQSYILFLGKILSFFIRFCIPIILVRILSKNDYGYYQLAVLISLTSIPIFGLGLNSSLYYFYPIYEKRRGQLLFQNLLFLFVSGTIVLLIYLFFQGFIDTHFADSLKNKTTLPIALSAYFMFVSSPIDHLFIIERKAILNATYVIIEQILRSVLVIASAFYFKSAYYAIWSLAFFYLFRTMFLMIYLVRTYEKSFVTLGDKELIVRQLKYALPFGGSVMIAQVGDQLDRFIVTAMSGISKFASYSVAKFNIPFLYMFFDSLYNVALPQLSKYSSKNDLVAARSLLNKILTKSALVTIPIVIYTEVYADGIIRLLFTDKYMESVLPFRILVLMPLFHMTARGLILRSFNRTTVQFRIALIQLIVAVTMGVIMTKMLGITGAAISFVISNGIAYIMTFLEETKILDIKLSERLPFRDLATILGISILSLITIVPIFLYKGHIGDFITMVISLLVYSAFILMLYQKKSYINIKLSKFTFATILSSIR